jgi:hypothetical protein
MVAAVADYYEACGPRGLGIFNRFGTPFSRRNPLLT